jgi:hypothetical protein
MSKLGRYRDRFAPWAGLAIGVIALAVAHQFGSDGMFDDCAAIAPVPLLLVTLIGIALITLAGVASWRVAANPGEGSARRLVALISSGSA